MRYALAAVIFMASAPVMAGTSNGLTDAEQPFCRDKDSFVEYVRATMAEDALWMKSIKGCGLMKGGIKLVLIDKVPGTSAIGSIAKVRLIREDGESVIGYTFGPE